MPERELPEAARSIEEFGVRMHEMAEVARKAAERIQTLMKASRPQTMQEWEEAYSELYERHQRLLEAADHVEAVAMIPPGEDGTYRLFVSTRALDALQAEVFGDRTEGGG